MSINKTESEWVYKITGAAIKVLNTLGHGLREKTYERALVVELKHRQIGFRQQASYPVIYRDEHIDDYIPDLLVEEQLIVDAKTIDAITDSELGQMINYLKISGLSTGLILNFKHAKLEWRTVSLTKTRKGP